MPDFDKLSKAISEETKKSKISIAIKKSNEDDSKTVIAVNGSTKGDHDKIRDEIQKYVNELKEESRPYLDEEDEPKLEGTFF